MYVDCEIYATLSGPRKIWAIFMAMVVHFFALMMGKTICTEFGDAIF